MGSELFVADVSNDGIPRDVRSVVPDASVLMGNDEFRPSVAISDDGAIGLAWTNIRGDVYATWADSLHGPFGSPVRLNQDTVQTAIQGYVRARFADKGNLHTVWLDARRAGPDEEEPADLYYRLADGSEREHRLTSDDGTVCGCCRPDLAVETDGEMTVAYRAAGTDGYRDVSYLSRSAKGEVTVQRATDPMWKIQGCPVSGPAIVRNGLIWKDASQGHQRILSTQGGKLQIVTAADSTWTPTMSPKRVSQGRVFVPGQPVGKIYRRNESSWEHEADVPEWVSSLAATDDMYYLVGAPRRKLKVEVRAIDPAR